MALAGKGATIKVGTAVITEMENWKLDIGGNTLETTNFGSAGWKQFIQGLKEWSGSCEGNWNVAGDTSGQKALQDALLNGTTVSVEFNLNGTNKYTGTAYVTKISTDAPVGDKIKVSIDLQGTGALTYA